MTRRLVASLAAVGLAVGLLSATSVSARSTSSPPAGTNTQPRAGRLSDPQFSTLVRWSRRPGSPPPCRAAATPSSRRQRRVAKVPKATLDALARTRRSSRRSCCTTSSAGACPPRRSSSFTSAKTLNGASVRISVRRDKVYLNGSTRVTKTNVRASNGLHPRHQPGAAAAVLSGSGGAVAPGARRGGGRRSVAVVGVAHLRLLVVVLERGPEPADRLAEPAPGLSGGRLGPEDDAARSRG